MASKQGAIQSRAEEAADEKDARLVMVMVEVGNFG